jgi:hypothetical protein
MHLWQNFLMVSRARFPLGLVNCLLFSGCFLDNNVLYPPFSVFYQILPYSYYVGSVAYINLHDAVWDKCTGGAASGQAVCVESGDPIEVLEQLSTIYTVVDSEDHVLQDMLVILTIALVFKVFYVIGVYVKTHRVVAIRSD